MLPLRWCVLRGREEVPFFLSFPLFFLCRSFFFFIHHHLLLLLHGSGAIVRSLDDMTLVRYCNTKGDGKLDSPLDSIDVCMERDQVDFSATTMKGAKEI
jgi:hypothetical protein